MILTKKGLLPAQGQSANTSEIPYKDRIINRIRQVYSIDDELAVLRQKDTKPEEFATYNDFVEQIKIEEKAVLEALETAASGS